jgi:hypothetical protein
LRVEPAAELAGYDGRRLRALVGPELASVAGGPRPPAPAAGHRRAWRPQLSSFGPRFVMAPRAGADGPPVSRSAA